MPCSLHPIQPIIVVVISIIIKFFWTESPEVSAVCQSRCPSSSKVVLSPGATKHQGRGWNGTCPKSLPKLTWALAPWAAALSGIVTETCSLGPARQGHTNEEDGAADWPPGKLSQSSLLFAYWEVLPPSLSEISRRPLAPLTTTVS